MPLVTSAIYLVGMAEVLARAQLRVKLGVLVWGADDVLLADSGRAAGYAGCHRGICVKVEDEV